jgi:hypothetical protein
MFSVQQSVDKCQGSSTKALILKLGLTSWDFTNANQSLFQCLDCKTMILSMHFLFLSSFVHCVSNKSSAHCDSFCVILFMKFFVCIMGLIKDVWFFSCIVWTMSKGCGFFYPISWAMSDLWIVCIEWFVQYVYYVRFFLFFLWAMNNLWVVCSLWMANNLCILWTICVIYAFWERFA